MKAFPLSIKIVLVGILAIPMGVFAAQSGGGYIVYDQINNSTGINLGNGFTNKSGGNPMSSQSMSGGGFISFGGAYRNSAGTPPPPSPLPSSSPLPPPPAPIPNSIGGGGGGVAFIPPNTNTNTNNPIVGFPLTGTDLNPLVFNNPVVINQPGNINPNSNNIPANENSSVAFVTELPAFFNIVVEPIKQGYQNISAFFIFFIIGIIFMTVIMIWPLFLIVRRRLQKLMVNRIINNIK